MHVAILVVLCHCSSFQDDSVTKNDSPRIQPIPFQITFQTKRKPVLQEAPPSSFIPPQSNSSGDSGSKNAFNPQGTFDPKGSFDPSAKKGIERPSESGFQSLENKVDVKPLRSGPTTGQQTTGQSTLPSSSSNSFSLPSNSQKSGSVPPNSPMNSSTGGMATKQGNRPTLTDQKTSETPVESRTISPTPNAKPASTYQAPLQNRIGEPANGRTQTPQFNSQEQSDLSPSTGGSTAITGTPSTNSAAARTTPAEQIIEDKTYDPQLREISDLILRSIKRPQQNRFSLESAVRYAKSPAHRKQIVKQYWSSFVVSADLQFAQQEVQILTSIPSPRTQLDQMLLRAATSSAQARLAEAQLAYKKSIMTLHRLSPGFDTEQPLAFADLPWIGKYTTHSVSYVQSGMFDQKIRQIDRALPAIRDLIYLRGAAVYDNLGALQESIAGLQTGQAKMETVLGLHKEVRDQRIEFCKNVRTYNHAIADYAISVFPNASQPLTVAKMLVDTELTLPASATILDRNVRQASGNSMDLK